MKASKLIDETAESYTLSTRATNDTDGCEYLNLEGEMCDVGRCLIDPGSANKKAFVSGLVDLDSLLKEEYRGHCIEFWEDLQSLHDRTAHWDENGLSQTGRDFVEELHERWDND